MLTWSMLVSDFSISSPFIKNLTIFSRKVDIKYIDKFQFQKLCRKIKYIHNLKLYCVNSCFFILLILQIRVDISLKLSKEIQNHVLCVTRSEDFNQSISYLEVDFRSKLKPK